MGINVVFLKVIPQTLHRRFVHTCLKKAYYMCIELAPMFIQHTHRMSDLSHIVFKKRGGGVMSEVLGLVLGGASLP